VCHNMSYTWRLAPSNERQSVSQLLPRDTLIGLRDPVININRYVFASTNAENYELVLSGR